MNSVALTYDARGSLTGDGTWTYAYDTLNRLTSADKSGMSASYAFDPAGRRLSKTVNGTVTSYLYDGVDVIGEYDGSGNLLRRYVPGDGVDKPGGLL